MISQEPQINESLRNLNNDRPFTAATLSAAALARRGHFAGCRPVGSGE